MKMPNPSSLLRVISFFVAMSTLAYGAKPDFAGIKLNDIECYIYPSYVSRIAGINVGEIEKIYTIKVRFRAGAGIQTELGVLTRKLLDGASLGDDRIAVGDFRYALVFYGESDGNAQTIYLDGYHPIGIIGGRQLRFDPAVFNELRRCLDGFSGHQ